MCNGEKPVYLAIRSVKGHQVIPTMHTQGFPLWDRWLYHTVPRVPCLTVAAVALWRLANFVFADVRFSWQVTKLPRISRWNAMTPMHDNDIIGRLWVSLSYSYQHSNCAELDPPLADTFVAALKFKRMKRDEPRASIWCNLLVSFWCHFTLWSLCVLFRTLQLRGALGPTNSAAFLFSSVTHTGTAGM